MKQNFYAVHDINYDFWNFFFANSDDDAVCFCRSVQMQMLEDQIPHGDVELYRLGSFNRKNVSLRGSKNSTLIKFIKKELF